MQLFSEYVSPLVNWLQMHPHWALLFTFLISFAESLAIVGSIIPGSITMTAIGILAGSGIMRIDLTLISATLGAMLGDSASYLLGHTFRDRIVSIWPFKKYPNLLHYGQAYFKKHGGKSVLLGRFIGPLRSIIPVIAGMMGMSQLRFFLANFLSAILWSLLYVLPGVLIGAASVELSPESAARVFVLVMILLGLVWLFTVVIKWLVVNLTHFLRIYLHQFWTWAKYQPYLRRAVLFLTPLNEENYYQTASLFLYLICSLFLLILISLMVVYQFGLADLNRPIQLFLQSLRTVPFDAFFIITLSIICPLNIFLLAISIFILSFCHKNNRQSLYWLSLHVTTILVLWLLHYWIPIARPEGLLNTEMGTSYPFNLLTIATAQYSSLIFYASQMHSELPRPRWLSSLALAILLLNGFAAIYLGDHWLTDVLAAYCCGIMMSLLHWLLFRRRQKLFNYDYCWKLFIAFVICLGSLSYWILHFDDEIRNHQPYYAHYVFTDAHWWQQTTPLLPVYRTNRIGKPIAFFNIQYAGSLYNLETALTKSGWKKENDSFFYALLKRINAHKTNNGEPIMSQLYLNRKPVLEMSYQLGRKKPILMVRIWRSNFHLRSLKQPIWLGSIESYQASKLQKSLFPQPLLILNLPLVYLEKALKQFPKRQIKLQVNNDSKLKLRNEPVLLLIKEPTSKESSTPMN